MKRRLIRIAILAGAGLVLLGITLTVIIVHKGPGTLQDWIGSQLQDIANSYLNPRLSFTDLAYEYPLTVSLRNLHLTADDPAHPGHTIDIIACAHAEVSLAEIPSVGKPIVIEKIALDEPLISAIAVAPRSKDFVGFSDLIRGGTNSSSASSSGSSKKLSDVFRMRLVQITNGKIVYDPRIEGTVPMTLDQINTLLNISPTDAGWYKLDTEIARKPVFDLQVKGQLNLDSFSVRDVDVKMLADLSQHLGQDNRDFLPPELQALLKQYQASGKLSVELTGSMPVMDPMHGQVRASVKLDRANLTMGGLRIPVDNLDLETQFAGSKVTVPSLRIGALGGWVDLSGSVALNERLDADLRLKIAGIVPEKLLADPSLASASPARLDLEFNLAASLMSLLGKAPAKPGAPLATVGLKNLRLSADDPVNPGQKIDVVACRSLDVALSEPVISGKPIAIDKIVLDRPVISAVSVKPGSMRFVGVPNFPAQSSSPEPAPAPAAPATAPFKLGDILRVKVFQLNDAKIIYDPRIPGTQRMCLDPINTSLDVDPHDPGSYRIDATLSRPPVFNLAVKGEIDVDDPGLQDLNVHLQADLTRGQLDFLPPQLQVIVKDTRAGGKLDLRTETSVAMSDVAKGKANIDLEVQNIDLNRGGMRIAVDDANISARLEDKKIISRIRISALKSVFEIFGTVTLNDRLDSDLTLKLTDVGLEALLAALKPNQPVPATTTKLNAEIEVQSPVMVAMGAIAPAANEPVAVVNVRNFRLTGDDPLSPGERLDFLSWDNVKVALAALPRAGQPVAIDRVVIEHPAVRAIAMEPESKEFAGFIALQNLAASQMPPTTEASTPEASTTLPSTRRGMPMVRLSDLVRLGELEIADASINYNPRIDHTVPMSLENIHAKVDMDSQDAQGYRFDVLIPSKPDFNLEIAGRINVDTMVVKPLTVDLTAEIGKGSPTYLPPQVQRLLAPYDPVGSLGLHVDAAMPLFDPTAGDLTSELKLDDVKATVGQYRIPVDHVRLPMVVRGEQVEFLDSSSMGGPMVSALGGSANLTGTVTLNDRLDSTIKLNEDGMLLQALMADKTTEPKSQLIGAVHLDLNLVNAPVLTVIAKAMPPSTQPSDPRSSQASAELPQNWGSAQIELTHAKLVGLALVQGMSNYAKSAFTDLFNRQNKDKPQTVVPKESAQVTCTFDRDHVDISQLHYEGEDIAADGTGYVTLTQQVDLDLTGGLISKLGALGGVGTWIKKANDSLLYYHVFGTFKDLHYEVKRGNGQPIVVGVKKIAKEGESAVGKGAQVVGKGLNQGLNQAGSFFHKLIHHNDKSQDQSQTQPSSEPDQK
ncbi:MAG: hypothetical protein ABSC42_11060 [Tepidisphaeraceae bacterium]|jgi:hypothetical protein